MIREKIQKFGSYLSGMVMPAISAFIAWGLITALFIETGWLPNEDLATLVGPMIIYLLPLLIAYNGGKLVYGERGGVVGATVAMGVIVGASIPMFLGAMIVGPLGGFAIKKVDELFEGKVKQGFEMLVNNFSAGIVAVILTIPVYFLVGPFVEGISSGIASVVEVIVDANLLFLVSILVEPAKVLFLNNALNHGIFGPLGAAEVTEAGKSIFFLLETNPGPGLGILLAFMFFGKGKSKATSPGAIIIHFFGGIHEIYFPYVLMKPKLILAAIAGGMSGVATFSIFDAGLVATPSPGSIIALSAMAPKGGLFPVLLGVLVSTVVSFLVAAAILKADRSKEEDIEQATKQMESMKGKKSSVSGVIASGSVQKIVFACDAGMGSSAMGASLLKEKLKKAGLDIGVTNAAIKNIPEDADLVVTQKSLTPQARTKRPNAKHYSVNNFLGSNEYDELLDSLK
ncbi:PTS mannitol transporter subunit IICB [Haloplasma contractile]|uniref:PTS system mannitol-specific EIICB component n=1 Tax=Haloplasma contractile SSD-17B TaxID=1033810 RepID=F7PV38_9MOLU|nr:PTS mannitol transporter subunit IICB [Haloplasma contractile]ERJ11272.1 PTS system mannitol-specific EIICB component protein [Haloplasma contractile SSD-17B]